MKRPWKSKCCRCWKSGIPPTWLVIGAAIVVQVGKLVEDIDAEQKGLVSGRVPWASVSTGSHSYLRLRHQPWELAIHNNTLCLSGGLVPRLSSPRFSLDGSCGERAWVRGSLIPRLWVRGSLMPRLWVRGSLMPRLWVRGSLMPRLWVPSLGTWYPYEATVGRLVTRLVSVVCICQSIATQLYPGLPSQLFSQLWKNAHGCKKSCKGRPGYEAKLYTQTYS